jgi:hypothetical protein
MTSMIWVACGAKYLFTASSNNKYLLVKPQSPQFRRVAIAFFSFNPNNSDIGCLSLATNKLSTAADQLRPTAALIDPLLSSSLSVAEPNGCQRAPAGRQNPSLASSASSHPCSNWPFSARPISRLAMQAVIGRDSISSLATHWGELRINPPINSQPCVALGPSD